MPRRPVLCLAIALPAALLPGCAAALVPAAAAAQAAGSGVAFWEGNKFRQAIPASPERVSDALDAELAALGLRITQDYGDQTDDGAVALRVARVSDDDEELGTVRIERMTDRLTYTIMTVRLLGKRPAVGLLMDRVSGRAVANQPNDTPAEAPADTPAP